MNRLETCSLGSCDDNIFSEKCDNKIREIQCPRFETIFNRDAPTKKRPEDHHRTKRLLEALAYLEHEQWAHWIKCMDKSAVRRNNRTIVFDKEHWQRRVILSNYDYDHLCERDKEKDREWAKKVLAFLQREGII